jgi:hypothetical protein
MTKIFLSEPPRQESRWSTKTGGSKLRFVTMVPESATGGREIPRLGTASLGCGSVPKPLAAVCRLAPPATEDFW